MAKSKWEDIAELTHSQYACGAFLSEEEITQIAIDNGIFETKIHAKTWLSLKDKVFHFDANSNLYKFIWQPPVKKIRATATKHNRTNNQDFGKYFECCTFARDKGEQNPPYWEHYEFDEATKKEVFDDAQYVLPVLPGKIAEWVGGHTVSGNGDLKMEDGSTVELKYLQNNSSGTYYNPTIYKLKQFGFDLQDYFNRFNYYDLLEEHFGHIPELNVSRRNKSPFNGNESKFIREENAECMEIYNTYILPVAQQIMEVFTQEVFDYFKTHSKEFTEFLHLILNKDGNKSMPDLIISFNYYTKQPHVIDVKKIADNLQTYNFRNTAKGMVIDETIRIQFSWKNGYGLFNPAMYIFIQE